MKKYDICVPREYKTKTGEKRTHFWKVGDAWPMKEMDYLAFFILEFYPQIKLFYL